MGEASFCPWRLRTSGCRQRKRRLATHALNTWLIASRKSCEFLRASFELLKMPAQDALKNFCLGICTLIQFSTTFLSRVAANSLKGQLTFKKLLSREQLQRAANL